MLIHGKRNGPDARVTAASITFADASQIHFRFGWGPWIRSYRDFHAKTTLAKAHAVHRFRMQIVRNELVVAFQILVGDIEEDGAVLALGTFLENSHGEFVTLEKRRQQRTDERLFQDFAERLGGQQGNQVGDESVIWRG